MGGVPGAALFFTAYDTTRIELQVRLLRACAPGYCAGGKYCAKICTLGTIGVSVIRMMIMGVVTMMMMVVVVVVAAAATVVVVEGLRIAFTFC